MLFSSVVLVVAVLVFCFVRLAAVEAEECSEADFVAPGAFPVSVKLIVVVSVFVVAVVVVAVVVVDAFVDVEDM